jgi:mRNA-degrading endonuclease RelE of RelBE toxin-antitoxin system
MGYRPKLQREAEKYLESQSKAAKKRIADAIDKLPQGDVVKLQGREGFRLTVGGFRVIFHYTNETTQTANLLLKLPE